MDAKRKGRLAPEAWVKAALATLQQHGIEQVRIEPLAKQLNVTKGSFYWHFKDRQDLLDSVLDYWFRELTETVFDFAHEFDGDPRARIRAVLHYIVNGDLAGFDLAVRAWAHFDRKAAKAVREVDYRRTQFLSTLFNAAGFNDSESQLRARLMYHDILGEGTAFDRQSRAQQLAVLDRKVEILTASHVGSFPKQGEHDMAKEFDAKAFRNALGVFATGVTIITTRDPDGKDVGVTANSFNSVSLDPPLVLWSLAKNARSLPMFEASSHFIVNVLASDQMALSNHFAKQSDDKFAELDFERGVGGSPMFPGCAASFQCKKASRHEGGDHIIYVGEVIDFDSSDRPGLLYHQGGYAVSVPHPDLAN